MQQHIPAGQQQQQQGFVGKPLTEFFCKRQVMKLEKSYYIIYTTLNLIKIFINPKLKSQNYFDVIVSFQNHEDIEFRIKLVMLIFA